MDTGIDRARIEVAYPVIAPYVRVTPVVEVTGDDFGLPPFSLALKLELFQHSGSFKALDLEHGLTALPRRGKIGRRRHWRSGEGQDRSHAALMPSASAPAVS